MSRKKNVQTKIRNGVVAALDVGTTKICCLIAKTGGDEGLRIVGIGHQAARGIRSGVVVDMEAAEASIRAAVANAEQMAGETLKQVTVNISAGHPKSRLIAYEVSVAGHEIGDADLRGLTDPSVYLRADARDHDIIHTIQVGYTIDGSRGVKDPRGMFGERLGVNLNLVAAAAGPVRNLETSVARCHLGVENKVVSAYAAALAALAPEEKEMGATLIDMGGGTTSIAVFFDGDLVHTDVVPVGGWHVTSDIARGLSTPLTHAERMKTLHGSALPSPSDDRETLRVPLIGEDEREANQIPRSVLVGIVKPRLEETFELVRAKLQAAHLDREAGRRVVLTGGASQLPGAREMAAAMLDKQVRLGRPKSHPGLAEAVSGPAFATCVGLLEFTLADRARIEGATYRPTEQPTGRLGRIGQWLREHL